ncbi:hypothetical protein [Streptomyces sp. LNU-CPARS28]|uniref:hypothetical protein n=1 Tax=Streptomyces sp. LNU-CPARS28 TaxID=3137371 RepID=UPI003136F353
MGRVQQPMKDAAATKTPAELRARAQELEDRVPPLTAGPRTGDERLALEKAAALRAEADHVEQGTIPGRAGPLDQRVREVIDNEVPPRPAPTWPASG